MPRYAVIDFGAPFGNTWDAIVVLCFQSFLRYVCSIPEVFIMYSLPSRYILSNTWMCSWSSLDIPAVFLRYCLGLANAQAFLR